MTTTTLSSFCQGAEQLLAVESSLTKQPLDAEMAKKLALWKTGMFRIVVMGEIKKGKSSFINALLGTENLVPVCDDVATSTVYKICYGENVAYRVFFTKESGKPVQTIQSSEVSDYGTEKGNPLNEKAVEFIQVLCPSPLLKDGLVVIDTPGLGGVVKGHKKITYDYVPKSDAVFVVTESGNAPLGSLEMSLIADLKKVTKHIYFVQTKSGSVSPDECKMRETRNKKILIESAGFKDNEIKYFVVDSAVKSFADESMDKQALIDSGFDKVSAFVNQYIRPNVHRILLDRAATAMKPKIQLLGQILQERERVCSALTDEARDKLKNELENAQAEVEAWERDFLPALQDNFQQGLQQLQDEAQALLEKCQPQSEVHLEIMRRIDAASTMNALQSLADDCNEKLPDVFTSVGNEIIEKVKGGTAELLNQFAQECLPKEKRSETRVVEYNANCQFIAGGDVSGSLERFQTNSLFETGRTALYGGLAGTAIAGVVGGVVGSIVPVVGTFIGSEIGMMIAGWWGAKKSLEISRTHQLEGAKSALKASITAWMNTNCSKLHGKINSLFAHLRLSASSQARTIIQTARKELKENLQRLARSSKDKMAEAQKDRIELSALKSKFDKSLVLMGVKAA